MNLNEDFLIHDLLNPKLWDSAGLLLPEVRKKLIQIIKAFEDELRAPIYIIDVLLVGSNAAFNYTDNSDIDLHIIANFEMITPETELLLTLYDLKKKVFNDNHNITIRGLEVELYVLDVNSGITSNGIYSVLDNKWIKEPKPMHSASKKNVEKELQAWQIHAAKIISELNEEEILNAINTIYLIRHNALAAEGEFSKGNTLYKELRQSGVIDRLKDKYNELIDRKLTLESFKLNETYKGRLINTLD